MVVGPVSETTENEASILSRVGDVPKAGDATIIQTTNTTIRRNAVCGPMSKSLTLSITFSCQKTGARSSRLLNGH
jgi:hypothetical protein